MALLVHVMILAVTSVGGVIAVLRLGVGLDTGTDADTVPSRTQDPRRTGAVLTRRTVRTAGTTPVAGSLKPNDGSVWTGGGVVGLERQRPAGRPGTRRNSSVYASYISLSRDRLGVCGRPAAARASARLVHRQNDRHDRSSPPDP